MISKRNRHPQFDAKKFEVTVEQLKQWDDFWTGQPKALLQALLAVSRKGTRTVTGKQIRGYLERHRKKLFPNSAHKDVLRIFQIYHAQLTRSGVLQIVGD